MNLLFVFLVILIGLALVFILPPLMRKPKPAVVGSLLTDSGALALQVLREQKAELDAERNAGRISDEDYQRTLTEIEQRALQEQSHPAPEITHQPSTNWAVAITFAVPLAAVAIYLMLGNPAAIGVPLMPPEGAQNNQNQEQQVTSEQINAMVARLAERVAKNPDDLQGMAMLARSYMVLQRYDDAISVYEKMAAKKPEDAQILADWADALATRNNRSLMGEPSKLLARAFKLDPSNPKVLALVGTAAFEKQDYAIAIKFWQLLLSKVENEPDAAQMAASIREGIAEAQKRLQEKSAASVPAK